jgi:NTE family protein
LSKYRPISLVLGGGGARGFAHIGAIKVFEKENIPISNIVGTSMGAIVGAVYAQLKSAAAVEAKFKALLKSPIYESSGMSIVRRKQVAEGWINQVAEQVRERIIISVAQHRKSAVSTERISKTADYLLDKQLIENLEIPFVAVSTDIITGEEVVVNKGPVKDAVIASASLPGFLPPFKMNGRLLIDGASTSPVPISAAKSFSKNPVVAVDVSSSLSSQPKMENIFDIVLRNNAITARHYHDILVREADVLVQPHVGGFHWTAFDKIDEFIQAGEEAAFESLNSIKKLKRFKLFFS